MPRLSSFYGIVIYMYFDDHDPPHFHAEYGEHHARFHIDSGRNIDGRLPFRAQRLVTDWAGLHRVELIENWARARSGLGLIKIEPLS